MARNPRFRRKTEEGKNEQKPTLASLSRGLPTAEEISAIIESLDRDDDRATAIVGAELVNAALMTALVCRFTEASEAEQKALFHGATSPLHSFSARILLGRAVGIYGPVTEKRLGNLKAVRNAFAHTIRPISFTHPLVVAECKSFFEKNVTAKKAYAMACHKMTVDLVGEAYRAGGKEITVHLP